MRLFPFVLTALALVAHGATPGIRTDIEYGNVSGESLRLDASVPEGKGPFPIAIIVHGGGWQGGDKQRDITPMFQPLHDAGFTWFSINYRVAPAFPYPACLEDVERAVAWVRNNAAKFKGDPRRIVLIGHSAGGHLVSMAAIRDRGKGNIRAVIGLAAVTDLATAAKRRGGPDAGIKSVFGPGLPDEKVYGNLRAASPVNNVQSGLAPFLLIHGTGDRTAPFGEQAVAFQALLRKASVECDVISIQGAPHRVTEWEKHDPGYSEEMITWLRKTLAATPTPHEAVVAADGSGQFKTVQQAVDAAPSQSRTRFYIRIKPGVYKERVVVPPEKTYLTFLGENAEKTIITNDSHAGLPGPDGRPINTFSTPTVFIQANDFTAENVTFENSAGPQGQAVALTIMSDRGVFRNCRFLGYQDTLLPQAGRQLFDRCYINGAVDFIFGGSVAWFDRCHVHATRNGYLTAANTVKDQQYGYVFTHSTITGEPGVKAFLGRPWRPWANTVFIENEMSDVVRPEGWNNWGDPSREKTVRYREYRNVGPGAATAARVSWAPQLTDEEAKTYTFGNVLGGLDGWNPLTGAINSEIRAFSSPANPHETTLIATLSGVPARIAFTTDGITWKLLPGAALPQAARDPRILRGPDGAFHLVWATGNKSIAYASSKDLSHWSEPRNLDVMAGQNALDVTSPNLYFDETSGQYIVTWASTLARNAIQAFQEDVLSNPRVWYATTRDFAAISEPKLLFDPNYAVRDAQILRDGTRYILLHNDNTRPMQRLRAAFSSGPLGPWGPSIDSFTAKLTQSPSALKLGDEWWIYHAPAGLVRTRAFQAFAAGAVTFPESAQPLSVIEVPRESLPRK